MVIPKFDAITRPYPADFQFPAQIRLPSTSVSLNSALWLDSVVARGRRLLLIG
jgi:hypothetical protein